MAFLKASSGNLFLILHGLLSNNSNALAEFRDKAGNNVWHYFFFRNPLFQAPGRTFYEKEDLDNYQILLDHGCSPDEPNNMGYSYRQLDQAMQKYLKVDKEKAITLS